MRTLKARARRTGWLYLLMAAIGPFALIYVPGRFIVSGDAAATARNINAGELVYRLGIFSGLVGDVLFLLLALSLYDLFRDVDRKQARVLVLMVVASASIDMVNLLNQVAPLILLSGAGFLSALARPQLESLSMVFLKLHSHGVHLEMVFWGLWLIPFGVLVYKSGWFPKILGVLLIAANFAYLAVAFTYLVAPAYDQIVARFASPVWSVGELPIIFWLAIMGAKEPRSVRS